MFLICATLLFSVSCIKAQTGAVLGRPHCYRGYCITRSEADITAEAGLCVVIPCSFTTMTSFTPQHLVWYKCERSKPRCSDSDIIFHTNKYNNKVQTLFKGRVSLLEHDVSQGNCSIIINDLTSSDSGAYQLRVNGFRSGEVDGLTYSQRSFVSVKGLSQKPSVMIPSLTDGQQTTLTCTAPVLCSGSNPEFTWTWRGAGVNDSQITGNITAFKTENLTAVTQRHSSTLTFNTSAEHHNSSITCEVSFTNDITAEETVTLNVTYVKKAKISGNASVMEDMRETLITGDTTVKEGASLNLTCSVESFPPSHITWAKPGFNTNLYNGPESNLQSDNGPVTLLIPNVTSGYSGQYICTAQHLNTTVTTYADVTVTWFSRIFKSSECVVHSGVLNCVCITEGFPLPTIEWPLLKKHTEYSVFTTVSNYTINSSLTLKHNSNTSVECVSTHENGEAKTNLTIRINTSEQGDKSQNIFKMVSQLKVIIAFFIGVLLSAFLCCFATKCHRILLHRNKQKISENLEETMGMVASQEETQINVAQAEEDYHTYFQEAAEEEGAVEAEIGETDLNEGPTDVEYASIDFSMLKINSQREGAKKPGTTETEYAEINKKVKDEREDNGGEEGYVLEEEEAVATEEEETKYGEKEEEEDEEDVALYSNVKEIMAET
ncbi:sialic acid-binding Ig-like lectin 5 isoform X2 [Eleginops maclovinus]|uniref:sialic acid-binding Ig-like lectin 5 isoform X2 n=1 Tax=Eleginops maclovinus TaxID=56733 RepID=UPI00308065F4